MTEETDLLPWLLGGMLALGAAAAIAVGVSDSTPAGVPAAPTAAAPASRPQAAPSTAAPGAAPADVSPVVAAANARAQLPPGRVWECEINGQRVFSDVQCGAHATVRQLSEQNVFDASVAYGRGAPRPYGDGPGPGPGPGPSGPAPGGPAPGHYDPQPGYASDAPPDDASGGDPIYSQVIVVHDRARRDQLAHHHDNHPHPRAAHP
jgi:translation initiation factor IF-2